MLNQTHRDDVVVVVVVELISSVKARFIERPCLHTHLADLLEQKIVVIPAQILLRGRRTPFPPPPLLIP